MGPSFDWDVHPKIIWCVNMSSTDSACQREAALFGHARLFQGAHVCRVTEEGRIRAWESVMVTYDDLASAPFSGGGAVSLAFLVFGAIGKAINRPGPSLICIPDQRAVEMLTER